MGRRPEHVLGVAWEVGALAEIRKLGHRPAWQSLEHPVGGRDGRRLAQPWEGRGVQFNRGEQRQPECPPGGPPPQPGGEDAAREHHERQRDEEARATGGAQERKDRHGIEEPLVETGVGAERSPECEHRQQHVVGGDIAGDAGGCGVVHAAAQQPARPGDAQSGGQQAREQHL